MSWNLQDWVLPHLRDLKPYSNARAEFKGNADVWLDANENPFDTDFFDKYNRYPDPLQVELKAELEKLWELPSKQIFLGNGSDEAIDLLIRLSCIAGVDKVLVQEPSYSMYQQNAAINNVAVLNSPLDEEFKPNIAEITRIIKEDKPKIAFFCSPNNPTGNTVELDDVKSICSLNQGFVVVDEAYIDFSPEDSALSLLSSCPNLVVLRTMSKAWGMAGLRLGAALASPEIIERLNVIKAPYNIGAYTQKYCLEMLQTRKRDFQSWVDSIIEERTKLSLALKSLPLIKRVFPSKANFILVQVDDVDAVYQHLISAGIVVRKRDKLVPNSLRISIGTKTENSYLIETLKSY